MAVEMYKCQRALKPPTTIQTSQPWVKVNNQSSSELKELLYTFAKCFTKELEHESAYEYSLKNDSDYQAFLFVEEGKMIGGCAFHDLIPGSDCTMPKLQWVWLIPSKRREGHFQRLWDEFTGDLNQIAIGCRIEAPMQTFIIKQTNWQVMCDGDLSAESGTVFLEHKIERS